jgi:hypothetical protein
MSEAVEVILRALAEPEYLVALATFVTALSAAILGVLGERRRGHHPEETQLDRIERDVERLHHRFDDLLYSR